MNVYVFLWVHVCICVKICEHLCMCVRVFARVHLCVRLAYHLQTGTCVAKASPLTWLNPCPPCSPCQGHPSVCISAECPWAERA